MVAQNVGKSKRANCVVCHGYSSGGDNGKHGDIDSVGLFSPEGENRISCIDCHDAEPHENSIMNKHPTIMACQTCHIPCFAKGMSIKIEWDWSIAGEDGIRGRI